eukprot:12411995-Karenia_brevis.AAC.1
MAASRRGQTLTLWLKKLHLLEEAKKKLQPGYHASIFFQAKLRIATALSEEEAEKFEKNVLISLRRKRPASARAKAIAAGGESHKNKELKDKGIANSSGKKRHKSRAKSEKKKKRLKRSKAWGSASDASNRTRKTSLEQWMGKTSCKEQSQRQARARDARVPEENSQSNSSSQQSSSSHK